MGEELNQLDSKLTSPLDSSVGVKVELNVLTYVTRFMGYDVAGLEAQLFNEIVKLAEQVKSVTVIASEAANLLKKPSNLKVYKAFSIPIPKLRGITRIFSYVLVTLLLVRKVNLIYVRTSAPPELLSALIARRVTKVPLVLLIGGTWPLIKVAGLKGYFYRALFNFVVKSADAVILYSWRMLPDVKIYAPSVDEGKVRVVRNAVDTQKFHPSVGCKGLRLITHLKPGEKMVLYVGRIDPLKGIEELIKATPLVLREVNAKFLLVGGGEPKDIEWVRRSLTALKVERSFVLVGPVPNREMPKYYCSADVFVLPSRGGEGIPRSILEAMACAKPVVATPVAGIPEVVKDGENGFLVPVKDHEALAQKLVLLLKDDGLRRSLGRRGRELVEKEFSWQTVIPKLIEVFESVKRPSKGAPRDG